MNLRFSGALALLARSLCCAQPTVPSDLRGIYIYTNDLSQVSKPTASAILASLNVPGVDGVALVLGWNAIETAPGQYQWTTLDQWMAQAISLGKKIDLVIPAGQSEPAWLFQAAPAGAGVTPLNFTISPHSGATGLCQSETLARPWDPAFLARWDSLLAAVAAHLKSTGAYNAVTLLRLTGINRTTEEMRLPSETAQSTGLTCVSDALTTWQQAGYKPSLLLQAWDQITSSFQKSFPDKSFGVSIIPTNPFPAIAEDGSVIKGTIPDQNQPLLALAAQKFAGRFVVQYDFLMPGEAASPEVIQAAQTLNTMAAFQTNEYFGQTGLGAACSEPVTNPAPCTAATFLQMLETGIYPAGQSNSLRAQYIEVFHANASAFPDDIEQAHQMLLPDVAVPQIAKGGVVIHAGVSPLVSPGSLVDIYGSNLAPGTASAPAGASLPIALGGVQVLVNGTAAPLIYVSPAIVIFQLPYETAVGTAQVVVLSDNTAGAAAPVTVQAAAPSILTYGTNRAVVLNQDYSVNAPGNGAKPGSVAMAYLIGSGPLDNAIATGGLAPASPLSRETLTTTVTVGASSAAVGFAGMAPDFAGLVQVNFTVPNLPAGDYPLQVTIGGAASNQPVMAVGQ
jgi:uncharacterized protein (TIGR03437 family)